MTHAELVAQWELRRQEGDRLGALVPLGVIAADVLSSLRSLERDDEVLSVRDAARDGGYSEDHLRREIAAGRIPNAGRKGKPAIRRADVPRKPGHAKPLPSALPGDSFSARRRIVHEATNPPSRSA